MQTRAGQADCSPAFHLSIAAMLARNIMCCSDGFGCARRCSVTFRIVVARPVDSKPAHPPHEDVRKQTSRVQTPGCRAQETRQCSHPLANDGRVDRLRAGAASAFEFSVSQNTQLNEQDYALDVQDLILLEIVSGRNGERGVPSDDVLNRVLNSESSEACHRFGQDKLVIANRDLYRVRTDALVIDFMDEEHETIIRFRAIGGQSCSR